MYGNGCHTGGKCACNDNTADNVADDAANGDAIGDAIGDAKNKIK
jgi:hypothetical protein